MLFFLYLFYNKISCNPDMLIPLLLEKSSLYQDHTENAFGLAAMTPLPEDQGKQYQTVHWSHDH